MSRFIRAVGLMRKDGRWTVLSRTDIARTVGAASRALAIRGGALLGDCLSATDRHYYFRPGVLAGLPVPEASR